ncbi:hypothetical protein MTO96_046767 [Rhipicephalus appendiculatus]
MVAPTIPGHGSLSRVRPQPGRPSLPALRRPYSAICSGVYNATSPPGPTTACARPERCHFLAQWLRQKLDFNVDPCEDFYRLCMWHLPLAREQRFYGGTLDEFATLTL